MRISSSFSSLYPFSPLHKSSTTTASKRKSDQQTSDDAQAFGAKASPRNLRRAAVNYGSCGDMLTQHNDIARTGAAACETQLNPASVSGGQFGKLYSRAVDGEIYAQPLYVSGVSINGETKNVIVVATMNNSVYVFDADDASATQPLWSNYLGAPVPTSVYGESYKDAIGLMGILGTPVIDKDTGLIYTVSAQTDTSSETPVYKHVLTALNLADGTIALGGAQTIAAAGPGTYPYSVDGVLSFDSVQHIQRPGLLLNQGQLVVAFGSHGDYTPYHGWLMSYDATSLVQTGVFSSTTASLGGSIWQSGQGIAVGPDGSLYGATANGFGSDASIASERVESLLKFTLNPGVQLVDSFTPSNYESFEEADLDFGSCGPIVPPNSARVVSGGKDGKLYSLPQTNLGGLVAGDPTAQEVAVSPNSLYGAPVYFNSPTGPQLFIHAPGDALKGYSFIGDTLSTEPVQINSNVIAETGVPGGILTVSTNGDDAASGIVWANLVASGNANQATQPGVLKAFAASDITQQLWSSDTNANDALGSFGKFVPPTVANGKVFMATFSNQLVVYGLAANSSQLNATTSSASTPATGSTSTSASFLLSLSSIAANTSATLGSSMTTPIPDFPFTQLNTSSSVTPVTTTPSNATTAALPPSSPADASSSLTEATLLAETTTSLTEATLPSGTASSAAAGGAVGAGTPTVTVTLDCASSTADVVTAAPVTTPVFASATSSSSSCITGLTDVVNIPVVITTPSMSASTPAGLVTATSSMDFSALTTDVGVLSSMTTPQAMGTAATPDTSPFSFATLTDSLATTPTDMSSVASLIGTTTDMSTAVDTKTIGNQVIVASTTLPAATLAPVFVGAAAGNQVMPSLALAAVLVHALRAAMA